MIGLLRLRKCSSLTYRKELKGKCSIVRELHVYGSVVPVSSRDPAKFQHQGFGTLLMEEACRVAPFSSTTTSTTLRSPTAKHAPCSLEDSSLSRSSGGCHMLVDVAPGVLNQKT